jgi:hypothetical protein
VRLLAAIEAYLRAHEEHFDFAGVAVEFISQTGLNPESADRRHDSTAISAG